MHRSRGIAPGPARGSRGTISGRRNGRKVKSAGRKRTLTTAYRHPDCVKLHTISILVLDRYLLPPFGERGREWNNGKDIFRKNHLLPETSPANSRENGESGLYAQGWGMAIWLPYMKGTQARTGTAGAVNHGTQAGTECSIPRQGGVNSCPHVMRKHALRTGKGFA